MHEELISPSLRLDFREFCVAYLVLRQIDDCFTTAGITKSAIPANRVLNGQRRALVEEYYSSLNWSKSEDADKFLRAVQIILSQSYLSGEPRKTLQSLLEREGYDVDHLQIRRSANNTKLSNNVDPSALALLNQQWIEIAKEDPQKRGFAFEALLGEIFEVFGLTPRASFRLVGEQIDGSFQFASDIYLVEAKWHLQPTPQSDLLVFREKVESKSVWTRGLFVSYSGFSQEGLTAFARGRATNIVGMDGQDLYFVLAGQITLADAIVRKVRRAAETGEFFVPIFDLLRM